MVYSTQELYLKYSNFQTPHVKIQTEVKNERLFPVVRGLYEDNRHVDAYLLSSYIRQMSYISFEYALSMHSLIPERVFTVTAATVGERHSSRISTPYGSFWYRDIPKAAFMYGVEVVKEGEYAYARASAEKALCDLLSKKPPVSSVKAMKEMLFDDLRIDEEEFFSLKKDDISFLCPLYRKRNLEYLKKFVEKSDEFKC